MKLFKPFAVVLTAALLFAGGARSQAASLADLLLPNATFSVGDKVFSNFAYSPSGDMPAASSISVFADPITNPMNPGLTFHISLGILSPGTSDGLLKFQVTSTGNPIEDFTLSGNPAVLSGAGNTDLSGLASITETITDQNHNLLAQGTISDQATYSGTTHQTTHILDGTQHMYWAPPVQSILVSKDILFVNNGLTPTLSYIDQHFSQVPEPGVLGMLLSSGIAGSLFLIRRKA